MHCLALFVGRQVQEGSGVGMESGVQNALFRGDKESSGYSSLDHLYDCYKGYFLVGTVLNM